MAQLPIAARAAGQQRVLRIRINTAQNADLRARTGIVIPAKAGIQSAAELDPGSSPG